MGQTIHFQPGLNGSQKLQTSRRCQKYKPSYRKTAPIKRFSKITGHFREKVENLPKSQFFKNNGTVTFQDHF
jgi:hypothetical protein